jgi:hypothetical protein
MSRLLELISDLAIGQLRHSALVMLVAERLITNASYSHAAKPAILFFSLSVYGVCAYDNNLSLEEGLASKGVCTDGVVFVGFSLRRFVCLTI